MNQLTKSEQKALRIVYSNGIKVGQDFYKLTDDELTTMPQIGVGKLSILKKIRDERCFDIQFLLAENKIETSKVFIRTLQELNISKEELMQTSLSVYKNNLTKPQLKVLVNFKSEWLRQKFNNTSNQEIVSEMITQIIFNIYTGIFKKFRININEAKSEKLYQYLVGLKLENIDLEKHLEEIIRYIDLQFILSDKKMDFLSEILISLLSLTSNKSKGIPLITINHSLQKLFLVNSKEIVSKVNELAEVGFVEQILGGIRINTPSIEYFLSSGVNKEIFKVIDLRIQQKTLQEIGLLFGVTRQRVRQLELKEKESFPVEKISEFMFKYYYESFDLTQDEFCETFSLTNYQYGFLAFCFKKNKELIAKEVLINYEGLNTKEKTNLHNILNKEFFYIKNKRVHKSREGLTKYGLETYAREEIKYDSFYEKMVNLLQSIEKVIELGDYRAYLSYLTRQKNIIMSFGKMLRHHHPTEADLKFFTEEINLNRYLNQEISTSLLYVNLTDKMLELDIRNEYELHFIMKRYFDNRSKIVKFGRMPMITVGEATREDQVLDLLFEMKEVTKENLIEQYCQRYGVNKNTIAANYLEGIAVYYNGDKYKINMEDPSREQTANQVIENLKGLLTKEFYFKEDIVSEYAKIFGMARIYDYFYKEVGYKQFTDFVVIDKYSRADSYFIEKYFQKDLFEIEDKRLHYLGSFRTQLAQRIGKLELFEFADNSYISLGALEKRSTVIQKDFIDFLDTITKEVGDKYFTLYMIENIIEKSPLGSLGFEDVFFESLIKHDARFQYQSIRNVIVFQQAKNKFYTYTFIEEIVSRFKYIEIYDLVDMLSEKFNIEISKDHILDTLENTNIYYNPIMEMLYQDVEEFYEIF